MLLELFPFSHFSVDFQVPLLKLILGNTRIWDFSFRFNTLCDNEREHACFHSCKGMDVYTRALCHCHIYDFGIQKCIEFVLKRDGFYSFMTATSKIGTQLVMKHEGTGRRCRREITSLIIMVAAAFVVYLDF
ncbi:hypothetical protein V6N13_087408 [Hibiscus sabdariffa]|uniref:Uncharacterized protein n=1 Tax=Hibiscus sabdariffa TaxID=183260 RepID=A0ABR2FW57_9ROSI